MIKNFELRDKKLSILEVLSKDKIERLIVPYLSRGKRGTKPKVELGRIVAAILYRLKSGCQWRMLPVIELFGEEKKLSPGGVYHHFSAWVKDGSFKRVWIELLKSHRALLDLSVKALIVRLETSVKTWTALHFLAFCVLLSKKITPC